MKLDKTKYYLFILLMPTSIKLIKIKKIILFGV
jgi:hypothetical protein